MATERTVYVVDDDPAVRRSLGQLLYSADFECVGYQSALAFLEAAPGISAGCVLLDVKMPELDGLAMQRQLTHLGFDLPVIVITGHGDISTAVAAMKGGAVDFIEKPFDDKRLFASIEAALASARRGRTDREAAEAAERIATLSPRERQVLDGLVAGRPSKVIAHDLGISVTYGRGAPRPDAGAARHPPPCAGDTARRLGRPGVRRGKSRPFGWQQRARS